MTVFERLKDLQEQEQIQAEGGRYGSWTIIWSTHHKWWVCSLLSCDQPMPGCGGDSPKKSFYADNPYDCVHEAWKSEKETEVKERAELERLREMHGMVRGAGEKPQTPQEIRAELARLRELFDMQKEAGE